MPKIINLSIIALRLALAAFWMGTPAHGDPMAFTDKVVKPRYAVMACYSGQDDSCAALRKRLTTNCEPKVTLIELPLNTTPADVPKEIAKVKELKNGVLPDGTPVFIVAHGMIPNKYEDPHKLFISRDKEPVDAASLMEAIQKPGGKPAFWVNSCFGGQACDNTKEFCVGSVCQKNTESVRYDGNMNPGTAAIAELYCDKKKFDEADTNKDGKLDEGELNGHFCNRVPHGRPYTMFIPPGKGEVRKVNEAKTKEMFGLLLGKQLAENGNGDIFTKDQRKRLLELTTENDKEFNERYAKDKEYSDAFKAWEETSEKTLEPLRDDLNASVRKHNDIVYSLKQLRTESDEYKKAKAELKALAGDITKKRDLYDSAESKLQAAPKWVPGKKPSGFTGDKSSKDVVKAIENLIRFSQFKGNPNKALWHDEEIVGESYLLVDLPEGATKACIYIGDSMNGTIFYRPNFKKFSLRFEPGAKNEGGDEQRKTDLKSHWDR